MPSERKNPDFYRAVKEYILKAHQILKEPYELKKSLGQMAERLDLPVNPFFLLIVENLEKIKDTTEYETCLALAQSDETISKHLDKLVGTVHTTRLRLNSENLMTSLLLWFTNDSTLSHFELNTFNSLYHRIENFFYSDQLKVSVVSPLWLFSSEVAYIPLDDNLSIRPIKPDEMADLRRFQWVPGLLSTSFLHEVYVGYVLDFSFMDKKVITSEIKPPVPYTEKTLEGLCALRVLKSGDVSCLTTMERPDNPFGGLSLTAEFRGRVFGQPYELLREDVFQLQSIYKRIEHQKDRMGIALRRLNQSYERRSLEDILIDYMVAFENLYLYGEGPGEKRFKLSHRAGLLLSSAETRTEERRKTYEQVSLFIQKAYDERSTIVHGGPRRKRRLKVNEDSINKLGDYLRQSIRLSLENPEPSWTNLMF